MSDEISAYETILTAQMDALEKEVRYLTGIVLASVCVEVLCIVLTCYVVARG